MSIRFGGRRELGYHRQENQDQVSRFSSPYGEVFLLADGMGGHEGGGIAANMAITGFERHFLSLAGELPLRDALSQAAALINADIYARGHAGGATAATMGSTLALVVVQKEHFVTAHMGDSRVYVLRDGRLKQLTRDHTAMQRMLDAGLMTLEEIRVHPDASVLTRALGQGENMEIEISEPYALLPDDVLMLCSDGLSGYVEDGPIEERLRRFEEPQKAADALAELALEAGGFDNISIWVVRASLAAPEPVRSSAPTPVEQPPAPAARAKAAPREEKHGGRWLLVGLLLLAAGGGGWLAWQNPDVRNWVQGVTGSAPASPAGTAAAPDREGKSATRGGTAAASRAPGAPAASVAPATPGASGEARAADSVPAAPAPAGAMARVVVVHLPNLGAMGSDFMAALRERLRVAGFDTTDKTLADPKNEPAWRLAPANVQNAQPGKQGIVVAVYLNGYDDQAAVACKVLECTSPPHVVDPADLRIFESTFAGRHIAVFALNPAGSAKTPEK
jgi:protein phosphatase